MTGQRQVDDQAWQQVDSDTTWYNRVNSGMKDYRVMTWCRARVGCIYHVRTHAHAERGTASHHIAIWFTSLIQPVLVLAFAGAFENLHAGICRIQRWPTATPAWCDSVRGVCGSEMSILRPMELHDVPIQAIGRWLPDMAPVFALGWWNEGRTGRSNVSNLHQRSSSLHERFKLFSSSFFFPPFFSFCIHETRWAKPRIHVHYSQIAPDPHCFTKQGPQSRRLARGRGKHPQAPCLKSFSGQGITTALPLHFWEYYIDVVDLLGPYCIKRCICDKLQVQGIDVARPEPVTPAPWPWHMNAQLVLKSVCLWACAVWAKLMEPFDFCEVAKSGQQIGGAEDHWPERSDHVPWPAWPTNEPYLKFATSCRRFLISDHRWHGKRSLTSTEPRPNTWGLLPWTKPRHGS